MGDKCLESGKNSRRSADVWKMRQGINRKSLSKIQRCYDYDHLGPRDRKTYDRRNSSLPETLKHHGDSEGKITMPRLPSYPGRLPIFVVTTS